MPPADPQTNQSASPAEPTRRDLIRDSAFVPLAALAATAVAPVAEAQKMPSPPAIAATPKHALDAAHLRTLDAFLNRLCPTDDIGPGAVDMGASEFINRALGDWLSAEATSFIDGLNAIDAYSRRYKLGPFADLAIETQDAVIADMEAGRAEGFVNSRNVFARIRQLMLQGMFSDPQYGGNRNFTGWDLIGYPGAVMGAPASLQVIGERLAPRHTSAYATPSTEDHNAH